MTDESNISEEITYNHNSVEVIDHTCDKNETKIFNTEEETDAISIHYINATNDTSMIDGEKIIHKYYAPFLSSNNN